MNQTQQTVRELTRGEKYNIRDLVIDPLTKERFLVFDNSSDNFVLVMNFETGEGKYFKEHIYDCSGDSRWIHISPQILSSHTIKNQDSGFSVYEKFFKEGIK